jgi:hypothetical protein
MLQQEPMGCAGGLGRRQGGRPSRRPGSGRWVLGAGCWALGAGCWLPLQYGLLLPGTLAPSVGIAPPPTDIQVEQLAEAGGDQLAARLLVAQMRGERGGYVAEDVPAHGGLLSEDRERLLHEARGALRFAAVIVLQLLAQVALAGHRAATLGFSSAIGAWERVRALRRF